jgi:hypothetical protein
VVKKWVFREEVDYVKVYEDSTGDIKCVYPKAPSWAADVAERIYNNIEHEGMPTAKGVKDIVRGQWGRFISEAAKKRN